MVKTLIIEDNPIFQKCLSDILRAALPEMQIIALADGHQAMATICSLEPQVAFIDTRLPGPSGIEITRQIRDAHKDLCVVVMTAEQQDEYSEAAFAAGASHFFQKADLTPATIADIVKSSAAQCQQSF